MSTLKLPVPITGFIGPMDQATGPQKYQVVDLQDCPAQEVEVYVSAEAHIDGDPEITQFKIGYCENTAVFCSVKNGKGEMRALEWHEMERLNDLLGNVIPL